MNCVGLHARMCGTQLNEHMKRRYHRVRDMFKDGAVTPEELESAFHCVWFMFPVIRGVARFLFGCQLLVVVIGGRLHDPMALTSCGASRSCRT